MGSCASLPVVNDSEHRLHVEQPRGHSSDAGENWSGPTTALGVGGCTEVSEVVQWPYECRDDRAASWTQGPGLAFPFCISSGAADLGPPSSGFLAAASLEICSLDKGSPAKDDRGASAAELDRRPQLIRRRPRWAAEEDESQMEELRFDHCDKSSPRQPHEARAWPDPPGAPLGDSPGSLAVTSSSLLAEGPHSAIYCGQWSNCQVAVKVMSKNGSADQAMAHAVEMAVLSSVQHPNIVSVYKCIADAIEFENASSGGVAPPSPRHGPHAPPPEPPEDGADAGGWDLSFHHVGKSGPRDAATCDVMVMELCDRGTLSDAIRSGAFAAGAAAARNPTGVRDVDTAGVLEALMDVASALNYLHSMKLVHGRLQPDNILLKSAASHRLGMQAKLCGFGLCHILNNKGGRFSFESQATSTRTCATLSDDALPVTIGGGCHSPRFDARSADGRAQNSVWEAPGASCAECSGALAGDVFAFGELILHMLGRPPAGDGGGDGDDGPLTADTLHAWSLRCLAADCMAATPGRRPDMGAVMRRLEGMLDDPERRHLG